MDSNVSSAPNPGSVWCDRWSYSEHKNTQWFVYPAENWTPHIIIMMKKDKLLTVIPFSLSPVIHGDAV